MNRDDRPNWLYGMLNGGPLRAGLTMIDRDARNSISWRAAQACRAAGHDNHEFLDSNHIKERSTFADGRR